MRKMSVVAIMLIVAAGVLFAPQEGMTQSRNQDQRFPGSNLGQWLGSQRESQLSPLAIPFRGDFPFWGDERGVGGPSGWCPIAGGCPPGFPGLGVFQQPAQDYTGTSGLIRLMKVTRDMGPPAGKSFPEDSNIKRIGIQRPVLIPRPTTFTRYSESAWRDPNKPWFVVP